MAEIDKGLPNTRTKLEVPSQEEIEEVSVQEPVDEKGPIEVIPEEDGGATLDFEPVCNQCTMEPRIILII